MKITQIATALNNVINELQIGAKTIDEIVVTPQVAEDLGNIVDVGQSITAFTGASSDNFDSFIGKLIDQVGKMIFLDRVYTSQAPDILVDAWEYGSVLMKVRCELQDARDNATWALKDYPIPGGAAYPDPFELSPPDVSAKFFNTKTTYEVPITLAQYQLEEAVRSAGEMQRLIAMIENRIQVKRTLCNDGLVEETIANLIAGKIQYGSDNVVDLLGLYNTMFSQSLDAPTAMKTADFLRFATSTMMKYKKYLAKASTRYNVGNYVTFTPADRLKFVTIADFAKDVEAYLYSGTYHDEFVKMDGYQEIASWQSTGSDEDRFRIYRYLGQASDGSRLSTPVLVDHPYVIAVMFDEWAALCANMNDRVTSIYNPRGEYTNFFYKWDASYLNDWFENCVVFVLGSGGNAAALSGEFDKGSASGSTKFTLSGSLPSGHSLKYNNVAHASTPSITVGAAYESGTYPTGTWSNYTSGSNITSAATTKTVSIIEIDADNKIVAAIQHKTQSAEIAT